MLISNIVKLRCYLIVNKLFDFFSVLLKEVKCLIFVSFVYWSDNFNLGEEIIVEYLFLDNIIF